MTTQVSISLMLMVMLRFVVEIHLQRHAVAEALGNLSVIAMIAMMGVMTFDMNCGLTVVTFIIAVVIVVTLWSFVPICWMFIIGSCRINVIVVVTIIVSCLIRARTVVTYEILRVAMVIMVTHMSFVVLCQRIFVIVVLTFVVSFVVTFVVSFVFPRVFVVAVVALVPFVVIVVTLVSFFASFRMVFTMSSLIPLIAVLSMNVMSCAVSLVTLVRIDVRPVIIVIVLFFC